MAAAGAVTERRQMGRPPKPASERLVSITIHVSPELEAEMYRRVTRSRSRSLAEYLRGLLGTVLLGKGVDVDPRAW